MFDKAWNLFFRKHTAEERGKAECERERVLNGIIRGETTWNMINLRDELRDIGGTCDSLHEDILRRSVVDGGTESRERLCVTCQDIHCGYQFPYRTPTARCRHPSDTCRRCCKQWIRSRIDGGAVDVRCPRCEETLDYSNIKALAECDVFER